MNEEIADDGNVENRENIRELRDRSSIKRPDYYGPVASYYSVFSPDSYDEAIQDENADLWKEAMEEEINALKENETWILMPKPENTKLIDNKWVFRIKTDNDGNANRYKARLVARGFTQQKDIDYKETFSPVVRYDSIRILLALATEEDLEFKHFDVKTAFLYGDIREDIYMKQPQGFEDETYPDYVCKLTKSLYGLKQASRNWNQ